MRRRPVSAAALAPAQLAYISYARYVAERTPLATNRWVRAGFPVLYGLLAAGMAVEAIHDSQARIGISLSRPATPSWRSYGGPCCPAPSPASPHASSG